jgi:hypothetical protein
MRCDLYSQVRRRGCLHDRLEACGMLTQPSEATVSRKQLETDLRWRNQLLIAFA